MRDNFNKLLNHFERAVKNRVRYAGDPAVKEYRDAKRALQVYVRLKVSGSCTHQKGYVGTFPGERSKAHKIEFDYCPWCGEKLTPMEEKENCAHQMYDESLKMETSVEESFPFSNKA